ncbi:hypothetical protein [Kitasatospora sp. NPDC056181]|uniref:hypothetical protein n=1 Tax=Kitasatospora sp. NPDC056181 TaxID=3345737 RepID=UPI0035E1F0D2
MRCRRPARREPAPGGRENPAPGESVALNPGQVTAACGSERDALFERESAPGCQAYSANMAWLALNGEPAAAVLGGADLTERTVAAGYGCGYGVHARMRSAVPGVRAGVPGGLGGS